MCTFYRWAIPYHLNRWYLCSDCEHSIMTSTTAIVFHSVWSFSLSVSLCVRALFFFNSFLFLSPTDIYARKDSRASKFAHQLWWNIYFGSIYRSHGAPSKSNLTNSLSKNIHWICWVEHFQLKYAACWFPIKLLSRSLVRSLNSLSGFSRCVSMYKWNTPEIWLTRKKNNWDFMVSSRSLDLDLVLVLVLALAIESQNMNTNLTRTFYSISFGS